MQQPSPILQFLPLIFIGVIFLGAGLSIAKRKGYNLVIFSILAFIPLVNVFTLLYVASLTDKDVLDAIKRLEKK